MANLTPCFSDALATLLTADLDNAKVSELRVISRGIVKAATSFKGSELRALLIQTRADVMAVIASQPTVTVDCDTSNTVTGYGSDCAATVTVSEESAPVAQEPVAAVSNTSIADNSTAIELAAIVKG